MLFRFIVVYAPLAAAMAVQGAVLLAVLATPGTPWQIRWGTIMTGAIAIVLHVKEQTSGSTNVRRDATTLLKGILLWVLVPLAAVVAVVLVAMWRGTVSFNGGALAIAVGVGAGVAWLVLLFALERRFGTLSALRTALTRYRPLFLIVLPPALTFIAVIGAASSIVLMAMVANGLLSPDDTDPAALFGGIEAVACVMMVFAWSWIVRVWLRSSWFWVAAVVLLHAVTAAHRTHRWDIAGPVDGERSASSLTSGPLITQTFDWPDSLAPLAGLALFLIWYTRRERMLQSAPPEQSAEAAVVPQVPDTM